jgi:hypothetical protein
MAIVDAFDRSLHAVFLCAIPLCLVTFPLFLLVKELPLRGGAHLETNEPRASDESDSGTAAPLVDGEITGAGIATV